MPTAEQLDRILALAETDQEVDYFFDQLTSPGWIPILRRRGMFLAPPEPVREEGGISFPGWSRSRFLARVAGADPDVVMAVLLDIQTTNPRIWRDILAAVAAMPAMYALPFIPQLRRWIHSPFQLGAEDEAAAITSKLTEAGMVAEALEVLSSLAALVPPPGDAATEFWAPLSDWDYQRLVPKHADALGSVSVDTIWTLAAQVEAAFDANAEEATGYSSMWRPAIENHPQNWRHRERIESLIESIRDTALTWLRKHPEELRSIVERLLARRPGILKRIGLHLLVERGDVDRDFVGTVLGTRALFENIEFHHEFYRLAHAWFGQVSPDQQARYLALIDEVGREAGEGEEPDRAAARADWWAWNRLGAVIDDLDGPPEDRWEALVAERGLEEHPDFLMWHESWTGSQSPLSQAQLEAIDLDALFDYLAGWQDPESFRPAPSRNGLARELQTAAANDPQRYAPFAERLVDLPPIYAGWFLVGLGDALKAEKEFDVTPAVALCQAVVERSRALDAEADPDKSWQSARLDAAHFIEDMLIRDRLRDDRDGTVWATIAELLTDPDPRAEAEGGYGDALTHSLNSIRGIAINAAVGYAWWSRKHAPDREGWRLAEALPDVSQALTAHLSPESDPSLAIGAAFGWWLEVLISVDPGWVSDHAGTLLGDLTGARQNEAWSAYLMRSSPGVRNYRTLRDFYARFADQLAASSEGSSKAPGFADPVVRYLTHLALLEVHRELPADGGPLKTVLASQRAWLLKEMVGVTGRLAHDAEELSPELAEAFRALWFRIRAEIESAGGETMRAALGGFSWWFASKLPPAWTLPELVSLLNAGVRVDPEFLVLPRLAAVAGEDEERTLQALEKLVPRADEEWAFRSHEEDLRKILRLELESTDRGHHQRARALVDRFGRLGMIGLGSLLN